MREQLLQELPWFVKSVARLPGVRKISLLGSITTDKKHPKDIDFLVTIEETADLEPLARLGRRISGHSMGIQHGADVFLANPQGHYIGRTCHWKDCRPGIRVSCDALHCGRRHYLHDDFKALRLTDETVRGAMQLWPTLDRRRNLPSDLEKMLTELEALGI